MNLKGPVLAFQLIIIFAEAIVATPLTLTYIWTPYWMTFHLI